MSKLPRIEIDPEEMMRITGEMHDDLGPPKPPDPGFTTREYAERKGIAYQTARRHLAALEEKGLLIEGKRYVRRAKDNAWLGVPVYRPKEEE